MNCAVRVPSVCPNPLPDHAPAGWRGGDGQEYHVGARLLRRFLERPGRTDTIRPIGMQGRLPAQSRGSGNFGSTAVSPTLGGDLGRCRLAGFGWAVVTWGRTFGRWLI